MRSFFFVRMESKLPCYNDLICLSVCLSGVRNGVAVTVVVVIIRTKIY